MVGENVNAFTFSSGGRRWQQDGGGRTEADRAAGSDWAYPACTFMLDKPPGVGPYVQHWRKFSKLGLLPAALSASVLAPPSCCDRHPPLENVPKCINVSWQRWQRRQPRRVKQLDGMEINVIPTTTFKVSTHPAFLSLFLFWAWIPLEPEATKKQLGTWLLLQ